MIIKAYLRKLHFLLRNRFKVILWKHEGKKYLAITATGWRGVKWTRRFEIVDELDEHYLPIPFKGNDAIKP